MKSTIHLFNTAIGRLGGEQLPLNRSPEESDATGTLCANLFPHVLDLALSAHEWSFAKRRAVLALLLGEGLAGHAYRFRYALPADCLRPVRLAGVSGGRTTPGGVWGDIGPGGAWGAESRSPAYVLEGNVLLTDVERAELLYVARVDDPQRWSPAFADALAWALAGELASARVNDSGKQQWCYQNYEAALSKAAAKDKAVQNPHRERSAWLDARGNAWTGQAGREGA